MTKGSVMPAYAHLMVTELNFNSIPGRIKAASMLGAEYDFELTEVVDKAKEQARLIVKELVEQGGPSKVKDAAGNDVALEETQVIAMIAYMQRVGADLFATETTPDETAPADAAGEPAAADVLPAEAADAIPDQ